MSRHLCGGLTLREAHAVQFRVGAKLHDMHAGRTAIPDHFALAFATIQASQNKACGTVRHIAFQQGRLALGLIVRDTHKDRSEEHTSELQSLMRISYAVFCLKKKTNKYNITSTT